MDARSSGAPLHVGLARDKDWSLGATFHFKRANKLPHAVFQREPKPLQPEQPDRIRPRTTLLFLYLLLDCAMPKQQGLESLGVQLLLLGLLAGRNTDAALRGGKSEPAPGSTRCGPTSQAINGD